MGRFLVFNRGDVYDELRLEGAALKITIDFENDQMSQQPFDLRFPLKPALSRRTKLER
ncbi:MAG: hypothetical protein KME50_08940 [Nostoc desertorum CM1-VF14]|jgi:hypothetical protein|nr:hypothetical protein [Nostoc desertorum CM1-VF14]